MVVFRKVGDLGQIWSTCIGTYAVQELQFVVEVGNE